MLTLSFCDDGGAVDRWEGVVFDGGSEYLEIYILANKKRHINLAKLFINVWCVPKSFRKLPCHQFFGWNYDWVPNTNPFCLGRCCSCPYCSSLPPYPLVRTGCGLACSPYPLFSNRGAWFCCWYAGGSEWRACGWWDEARMGVLVLVGSVLSRSSRVSSNWWWWWGSMARDRACCSREASTWGHASGMGWGRWISTCNAFIDCLQKNWNTRIETTTR